MAGHLLRTLYILRQAFPPKVSVSQLKTHLRGKRKYKKMGRLFKWGGFNVCFVERALQEHMLAELSCKMLLELPPPLGGNCRAGCKKIWEFKPVMSELTWVNSHAMCPQCAFIQVSFWSGPRPNCNDSEALSLNVRDCV